FWVTLSSDVDLLDSGQRSDSGASAVCEAANVRFSRESFLPWPVPSTPFVPFVPFVPFDCVGILGDLLLLADPSVVANVALAPLAVSILSTGSLSSAGSLPLQPADFLSSAEQFLLPAFHSCTGASLFPLPSTRFVSFDLAGFLSSTELFLLPAFVCPYSIKP